MPKGAREKPSKDMGQSEDVTINVVVGGSGHAVLSAGVTDQHADIVSDGGGDDSGTDFFVQDHGAAAESVRQGHGLVTSAHVDGGAGVVEVEVSTTDADGIGLLADTHGGTSGITPGSGDTGVQNAFQVLVGDELEDGVSPLDNAELAC